MEANSRLTSSTAVLLFFLLAAEGVTVPSVRSLLTPHVFLGVLLIPPTLVKIVSTTYRFARFYTGHPDYRRKGPPLWFLRLLGPVVVVLTVVMLASGVALMFAAASEHRLLLGVHKASFVLWFLAMTVHVLGHLPETFRLGLPDWVGRRVAGSAARRSVLVASLAVGAVAGVFMIGKVAPYLASAPRHPGG